MSKIHVLKIKALYFDAVVRGDKTFEIRKDDRNYQVGEFVKMREISLPSGAYTGREVIAKISYITDFMQKDDYVVFGLKGVQEVRTVTKSEK